MSTIFNDQKQIKRIRWKFTNFFINLKSFRAFFDELTLKKFIIFEFIDFYNYFMNDVNVIDQLRCYFNIQRVHYKTWKSLWHFLLNITICNSYKIINSIEQRSYTKLKKHNVYKRFKIELVDTLFQHSKRYIELKYCENLKFKKLTQLIKQTLSKKHESIERLNNKIKECVVCKIIDRRVKVEKIKVEKIKKSLQKLSNNNLMIENRRRRVSRNRYECKLYEMSLCSNNK